MNYSRPSRRTLVPALLALGLASSIHAQTVPPEAGTILRQSTRPPALPEAPTSVLNLPPPAQQASQSNTPIPVTSIRIEGNTLLPPSELDPLVRGLQGRTVTLGELQQAAQRIADRYHAQGYPLANAYIPAQTLRDGVVRLQVVEPRYDRIALDGHSRLAPAQAKRTLGVEAGQPVAQQALDRGLLLLNRTPGVRVAGTLVPGAQPATSSLQLSLSDGPLLHTQVHADNYGSDYTGRVRGGVDVTLDNPFGHGAQAALTTMTTSGGLLRTGGFSLTSPDLWHGLRAGAYGSRTLYRLGGAFAALEQRGRVNQGGVDLSYPLVLEPGRLLDIRVDALRNGFVQRSTKVGSDSRSHIRLARLSLDGAWADSLGGLTSGGISISRGVLDMDSTDARVADIAGLHAAGTFWVGQLRVQRDQPLPRQWLLRLTFNGQLASHTLDGSEKFYLGGPYGVMSGPVNDAGGEAGGLLDARLMHALPWIHTGRLQGALLLQHGKVWQRRTVSVGPSSQHLDGAGLGLDYQYKQSVNASLAYVHPIGSSHAAGNSNHNGEWWARLTIDL